MNKKISPVENIAEELEIFPISFGRFWKLRASPQKDLPKDCVLCLHGLESHGGWFEELAKELQLHRAVYAWNRLDERGNLLLGINKQIEAMSGILAYLQVRHERIQILGNSWGGVLALYFARDSSLSRFKFEVLSVAPVLFLCKRIFFPTLDFATSLKQRNLFFKLPFTLEDFSSEASTQKLLEEDQNRRVSISFLHFIEMSFVRRILLEKRLDLSVKIHRKIKVILPNKDRILNYKKTKQHLEKSAIEFVVLPSHHAILLEHPKIIAENILA